MRWIAMTLVLAAFSGCKGSCMPDEALRIPREPDPPSSPSMVPAYWMEAFSQGRLDLAAATFDEDAAWIQVDSHPKRFQGRKEIVGRLEAYTRLCPDALLGPGFIIPLGDSRYLVLYTFTGTQTGSLPGIPATGKAVGAEGAQIVTVQDMRIVDLHDFFNPVTMLVQAGLEPGAALPVPEPADEPVFVVEVSVPKDDLDETVKAAFGSTDPARALERLMAPDVLYVDHVNSRTARGAAGVARALSTVPGFERVRFRCVEAMHPVDRVVAHFEWTGRYLGAPGREHARGKVVTGTRLDVYEIEGGVFTRIESFGNPIDTNYTLDLERPGIPRDYGDSTK